MGADDRQGVITGSRVATVSSPAPAQTPRRGRRGYDLDTLLLRAAEVFNARGYEGASMEDLAAHLGITKSAIYHHVSGKAELLRLAVDRALDGLFAVLDEPDAMDGTATARLEHVVRGSVRVLADQLPFVTLLLRMRGNTEVEREALARRRELDRRITALVAEAEAEGGIRRDVDPALASRLLFGTVNSLVEWYRPERGLSADDLADVVVTMTFDGLRRS
jgi:AcrR family transcriptional regulator